MSIGLAVVVDVDGGWVGCWRLCVNCEMVMLRILVRFPLLWSIIIIGFILVLGELICR